MPTPNPIKQHFNKQEDSTPGFSPKQMKVLKFPYSKFDAIIADGAIRSGKTSVMSVSFILSSMTLFNGCNFIIAGKTVQSCERNVIQPLLQIKYLRENFEIKYTRTTHIMTVRRGARINYFYVFGGKDESSYTLVQGLTAAGALFDEVALMPQSFVLQAMARCSVEGSKLWFNCNPESPNHWFYKDWILHPTSHNALYLHFTMDDNPSLSEKKKENYRTSYSGVFFQRYIRGLWVRAEGLIYQIFANDNEKFLVDTIDYDKTQFIKYNIGVDFGGNGSKHTFVLTGITRQYQSIYALESLRFEPDTTAEQLAIKFCEFVKHCLEVYPARRFSAYLDSAEQVLIKTIRVEAAKQHLPVEINNSKKIEINDRIRLENTLMSQGRLFIKRSAKPLQNAFNEAVWDSKQETKDVRLDNGTTDIDSLDAFEYTIERERDNLINAILRR